MVKDNEKRDFLKHAMTAVLDAVANEHEERHYRSNAKRYVLLSRHGARVEIMFERSSEATPNIWCLEKAAGKSLIVTQRPRSSPATGVRPKFGKAGGPVYGRHSALERMTQLGGADLVCFTPANMAEFGQIVDRLRDIKPAELS